MTSWLPPQRPPLDATYVHDARSEATAKQALEAVLKRERVDAKLFVMPDDWDRPSAQWNAVVMPWDGFSEAKTDVVQMKYDVDPGDLLKGIPPRKWASSNGRWSNFMRTDWTSNGSDSWFPPRASMLATAMVGAVRPSPHEQKILFVFKSPARMCQSTERDCAVVYFFAAAFDRPERFDLACSLFEAARSGDAESAKRIERELGWK